MKRSDKEKILSDVHLAAKRLLGSYLVRKVGAHELVGKIVETEIYHENDPASHSCKARTKRSSVMFGPPGFSYVYFIYGMYHCFNIVCGPVGEGSAVLIRALEPIKNIDKMKKNRNLIDIKNLTNGPGKLCQALHITCDLNNIDLLNRQSPIYLEFGDEIPRAQIVSATRIGISKAQDKLYRFYISDSGYVSVR